MLKPIDISDPFPKGQTLPQYPSPFKGGDSFGKAKTGVVARK